MSKIYIVLVAYYPFYKKAAINSLIKLANNIGNDFSILVVNNSKECNDNNLLGSDNEIRGSNIGWEFSAWDEGLAHISSRNEISDDDFIVLANDTFCFNRLFNFFNRLVFSRAFRIAIENNNNNYLIGELCTIGRPYLILNHPASAWISTYLFGFSASMLSYIQPLDKVNSYSLHEDINFDFNRKTIELSSSSELIINHLVGWFFPDNAHGWYKLSDNDISPDLMKNKLYAVLNEKLLSATAESNNFNLFDVYSNKLIRKIFHYQRKIFMSLKRK